MKTRTCIYCGKDFEQRNIRANSRKRCYSEECEEAHEKRTKQMRKDWRKKNEERWEEHKAKKKRDQRRKLRSYKRRNKEGAKLYPCKICGAMSVNYYWCPGCHSRVSDTVGFEVV